MRLQYSRFVCIRNQKQNNEYRDNPMYSTYNNSWDSQGSQSVASLSLSLLFVKPCCPHNATKALCRGRHYQCDSVQQKYRLAPQNSKEVMTM